jgi:hypothetical protein
MVESLCAFDGIMITKVTISILTISAGIVIVLTMCELRICREIRSGADNPQFERSRGRGRTPFTLKVLREHSKHLSC